MWYVFLPEQPHSHTLQPIIEAGRQESIDMYLVGGDIVVVVCIPSIAALATIFWKQGRQRVLV